jgi:hypothetical protein
LFRQSHGTHCCGKTADAYKRDVRDERRGWRVDGDFRDDTEAPLATYEQLFQVIPGVVFAKGS